ncbi:MAG: alpha/beta fold hydrolase [Myxococcota bacterium]
MRVEKVEVEGGTISWGVEGEGVPVLLIQGTGIVGWGWRPQVEALRDRYRLAWFDHRGIGESEATTRGLTVPRMARDALAVMDALGWPRAHVAGHSLGGLVAQQLALEAPERVASLALLSTLVHGGQATRFDLSFIGLSLRMLIGTRSARRRAAVRMVIPDEVIDRIGFKRVARELAALVGRDDMADQPKAVMAQVRAMRRHDTSDRTEEIAHLPTLVMTGREDRIALPAFSEQLAGAFGVEAIVLEGTGHACTWDAAVRVNHHLHEHWSAHPVAEGATKISRGAR